MADLPPILDAETLAAHRGDPSLKIVAVDAPADFEAAHIPGAVRVGYDEITRDEPPAGGLMPDAKALSGVFSRAGLRPEDPVVVYDRSGGGAAGRLFFTLDVAGHEGLSILDGGLQAWLEAGGDLETGPAEPEPSEYPVTLNADRIADRGYIAAHLDDPAIKLLDVRSAPEYTGELVRAARGGHIPGALNLEWTRFKDERDRIVARDEALRLLAERGIRPEDEVVVYCQTHHRSAHTYTVLKALGFERVRGYPGSWSEWGNWSDGPVEDETGSR